MNLIVITYPHNFNGEAQLITQLFQNGLPTLHLRKPELEVNDYENYINAIPKEYHNKIVVHYHTELLDKFDLKGVHFSSAQKVEDIGSKFTVSKSFHSIHEIENCDKRIDYAFLSPIFNSISKQGYKSNFEDKTELKNNLSKLNAKPKMHALGGIDNTNINHVKELGFDGATLLGYIWEPAINNQPEETIKRFKTIQQTCQELDPTY